MARRVHTTRGVPAVRAQRRTTQWVSSADQNLISVAAATKTLSQSNASLASSTIVRLRGIATVAYAASPNDTQVHGALGMAIVSAQAFAIGVTAIPGPFDEAGWDGWLWHQYYSQILDGTAASNTFQAFMQYEIDSKAMRKLRDDTNVVVVIIDNVGAVAVRVGIHFRMLVKLT